MRNKRNFVIDRNTWARKTYGIDKGPSRLLNELGNMCCLGHIAVQLGCNESEIKGMGVPHKTDVGTKRFGMEFVNTNLMTMLLIENDDFKTEDKVKEEKITEILHKNGFGCKFIN